MTLRKKSILLIMVLLIGCFVCACGKENKISGVLLEEYTQEITSIEKTNSVAEADVEHWAKGYDLPMDEQERKEAENDCRKMMEIISEIYATADKGTASNVVLNDETILEMQNKLIEMECPITTLITYSNMVNYESVDIFLKECMDGKSGSIVVYEIHDDGGIGRMKFIFGPVSRFSTK